MEEKTNSKRKFDLEERTAVFGENILDFAKIVPKSNINSPLVTQLVRSGTSVGSNYCEADCAESRSDFEHKIGICKKESRETKHWLRMIVKAESALAEKARALWREANELNLIFTAIVRNSRSNLKKTE